MIYSAADLVKRSCAQIVYFRETGKEKPVSPKMSVGISFQESITQRESLTNEVACEMRGCYNYKDNSIFFCIDMVKNGEFFEIKSVTDENGVDTLDYPEWYLQSSLLQCVAYKTLLLNMDGNTLVTPKFRLDAGFEDITINVDKQAQFNLIFGNVGTFKVNVTDDAKVLKFIQDKVDALLNYTTARAFDAQYKHKEFEILRDCFTFEKII